MNSLEVAQWIEARASEGYAVHVNKAHDGFSVAVFPNNDAYPRVYAFGSETFIGAFDSAKSQFDQLNKA